MVEEVEEVAPEAANELMEIVEEHEKLQWRATSLEERVERLKDKPHLDIKVDESKDDEELVDQIKEAHTGCGRYVEELVEERNELRQRVVSLEVKLQESDVEFERERQDDGVGELRDQDTFDLESGDS
jgi:chromosome segregation ATPase